VIRTLIVSVALLAAPAMAADTKVSNSSQLVDAFIAAQRGFDQAALGRLTAPEYVEISPLGEVDPRDRMLGFYAPDKKQAAPEITVSERTVRVLGDTALVTARLAFGPGAMRAVYVARRDKNGWRLVSTQFTPIRTPPQR
jgi:ketosteroid isomerase-like protein